MLGAILGFSQSVMGQANQQKQNELQRQYEMAMYEKQKKDRIEFWNMENQYNTPVMQMKRLKDAGLNPNLVYGNGATATGGNIQAPEAKVSDLSSNSAPYYQMGANAISGAISELYNLRLMDAQTEKTREEALTQKSIRDLQASQSLLNQLLANKTQLENSLGFDTYNQKVKEATLKVEELTANIGLIGEQTKQIQANTDKIREEIVSIVDHNFRENQKQKLTLEQMTQTIAKTIQEVHLTKANISLTESNTKLTDMSTLLKEVEKAIKEREKHFIEQHDYKMDKGTIDQVIFDVLQALGRR